MKRRPAPSIVPAPVIATSVAPLAVMSASAARRSRRSPPPPRGRRPRAARCSSRGIAAAGEHRAALDVQLDVRAQLDRPGQERRAGGDEHRARRPRRGTRRSRTGSRRRRWWRRRRSPVVADVENGHDEVPRCAVEGWDGQACARPGMAWRPRRRGSRRARGVRARSAAPVLRHRRRRPRPAWVEMTTSTEWLVRAKNVRSSCARIAGTYSEPGVREGRAGEHHPVEVHDVRERLRRQRRRTARTAR